MARHLQGCAYAGVVSLFLLNPAHASVLTGDLIQAEYDYPIAGFRLRGLDGNPESLRRWNRFGDRNLHRGCNFFKCRFQR